MSIRLRSECTSYVKYICFFFNETSTTEIYTYLHTLSLHDALRISRARAPRRGLPRRGRGRNSSRPGGARQRRQRRRGTAQRKRPPSTARRPTRSEEHTSELQSLMRISYAVFCLKKKTNTPENTQNHIISIITEHKHNNKPNA